MNLKPKPNSKNQQIIAQSHQQLEVDTIGFLNNNTLEMLYNCSTTDNELKAGKATTIVSTNEFGKLKLFLDWRWLNQSIDTTGKSEYIEIE